MVHKVIERTNHRTLWALTCPSNCRFGSMLQVTKDKQHCSSPIALMNKKTQSGYKEAG